MSIRSSLLSNYEALNALYEKNLGAVLSLQHTLIDDILPGVTDELNLDEDGRTVAREWLEDTQNVFRVLKRHKFTTSFALESLRQTLIWRLTTYSMIIPLNYDSHILCLPPEACDPFYRPTVILNLAAVRHDMNDIKNCLMYFLERLRVFLKDLNSDLASKFQYPILQCSLLVDLKGATLQNLSIDLLTWYLREVHPRFPGIVAAVFVLNYSWTHSGMWNIAKRTLPESLLSRIFFPSKNELLGFFSSSALPEDFGGNLPPVEDLPNLLHLYPTVGPVPARITPSASKARSRYHPIQGPTPGSIPSSSSPSQSPPYTEMPSAAHRHMRRAFTSASSHRRTRDLLRTLAWLFWDRYKSYLSLALWAVVVLIAVKTQRRWRWELRADTITMFGTWILPLWNWVFA